MSWLLKGVFTRNKVMSHAIGLKVLAIENKTANIGKQSNSNIAQAQIQCVAWMGNLDRMVRFHLTLSFIVIDPALLKG
jgi:hypothetical protein